MRILRLCERYQEALSKKDLLAVQELFTEDAIISAPISGTANVRDFHTYLFASTKKTVLRFPNVIRLRAEKAVVSLQFSYTLSIHTGQVTVLDGVATFGIDENTMKFKSLAIVYD